MIALEKLLLLKTVTLFKQTTDDLLLHIVTTIVKEKRVNAGQLLLEKGGENSTMYVIVSGRVKVYDDNDHVITELTEREIFGELSALTGDSPVTSVSTITDCLLLTISSLALYDLMNFDAGISKGIIQALCKRTQSMSIQIHELLQIK